MREATTLLSDSSLLATACQISSEHISPRPSRTPRLPNVPSMNIFANSSTKSTSKLSWVVLVSRFCCTHHRASLTCNKPKSTEQANSVHFSADVAFHASFPVVNIIPPVHAFGTALPALNIVYNAVTVLATRYVRRKDSAKIQACQSTSGSISSAARGREAAAWATVC